MWGFGPSKSMPSTHTKLKPSCTGWLCTRRKRSRCAYRMLAKRFIRCTRTELPGRIKRWSDSTISTPPLKKRHPGWSVSLPVSSSSPWTSSGWSRSGRSSSSSSNSPSPQSTASCSGRVSMILRGSLSRRNRMNWFLRANNYPACPLILGFGRLRPSRLWQEFPNVISFRGYINQKVVSNGFWTFIGSPFWPAECRIWDCSRGLHLSLAGIWKVSFCSQNMCSH